VSFELFFSLRYLKAKRKQGFISIITGISVLGIMIGVMALIVVLAVMNGFREDLMKKILGVNSHLLIMSYKGGIEDTDEIVQKTLKVDQELRQYLRRYLEGYRSSYSWFGNRHRFNDTERVTRRFDRYPG
jgi:ABC-type lipoprotein release transport system permease subunit